LGEISEYSPSYFKSNNNRRAICKIIFTYTERTILLKYLKI